MIGGRDYTFPTSAGSAAIDFALRLAWQQWPSAVVEDAESGRTFPNYRSLINSLALGNCCEILVYKDAKAAKQWHERGADDSLIGTLIHLISSGREITIVVDPRPTLEVCSFLDNIEHWLNQVFFGPRTSREAA